MYKIFKDGEYEPSFLNQIEEFGALDYDVDEMLNLFGPSIFFDDEKEKIAKDLKTPGSILNRHYQHGKLHNDYRDKMLLETSDNYRQRKQLAKKINDFYGL